MCILPSLPSAKPLPGTVHYLLPNHWLSSIIYSGPIDYSNLNLLELSVNSFIFLI